ncbi:MAG: FtsX-like permease family protein [Fibrobacter sp.]|nr:FtsX-like permease family protein [Fibrobacter sp.]MBQ5462976.1 FtsX-like permease family protein [Fibrobacter sp.]
MNHTTLKIIYTNFWSHPVRSLGLVILTAIASVTLLSGVIFSKSLDAGFEQLSSRMGADLLIVPYGVDIQNQSILLQGDFNHHTLPREVLDFVQKLPGVTAASPQFYISTLSASCCDKKVNIIGFDPNTDFTIKPWIRKTYKNDFIPGSVIVGSDIQIENGEKIKFFDKEFTVVGTLEPLGNKLDQTIFADVETVELLRQAAASKGYNISSEGGPSSILANFEEGTDFEKISQKIQEQFNDLQVIQRKNIFDNVIATARSFKIAVWLIAGFFLFTVIAVIYIAFTVSTNERKREFATLLIIGATRKKLADIVLGESLLASGSGAVAGTLFGAVGIISFRFLIQENLQIPFLLPNISAIILTIVGALFIPVIAGVGASYHIAKKIGNIDVYTALKEDA